MDISYLLKKKWTYAQLQSILTNFISIIIIMIYWYKIRKYFMSTLYLYLPVCILNKTIRYNIMIMI